MEKKICWSLWQNPLQLDEEDDDEEYRDSYEQREERQSKSIKRASGPMLVGSMGVIPLNEHNDASKIYNFWMGHCNFDITEKIANKISSTPGVETLDIFSRYRFRLAIGKAFQTEVVQNEIEQCIVFDQKPRVGNLLKHLTNKYKYAAVAIHKSGEINCIHDDEEVSFQEKVQLCSGSGITVYDSEKGVY